VVSITLPKVAKRSIVNGIILRKKIEDQLEFWEASVPCSQVSRFHRDRHHGVGRRQPQHLREPAASKSSSVPRHSEINDDLAKKICKDLGVPTL
jgi:hypothetical protein